MQPLLLYVHGPTPNPIKVAILLEELELPYESKALDFKTELKAEPFISVNPNGRLPALEDPNTGVKIFESGAILEYLIETYDKEEKFHYSTSPEKWLQKSWLHFQMSGQGPYFGQKYWFLRSHSEKVPSAIERYSNEIKRVTNVLNSHLKKQGTPYLIGDKFTYADLAWIPWQNIYSVIADDWDWQTECPEFAAWHKRMNERPAVKSVYAKKEFQLH
ncbi:putative glutathione s-transferase protein [Botryosphaeria dothidea]|uniref:Glutathione s-transferase protein n=1 Tax=Botryosphaeria dothidea TaxID=55169 RepID=A0A8H4J770_9PEZI|nr:putative glutathione s-transferase protein [Botryosphaeria dothidea]